MPTARELLAQADALMRRNRTRGLAPLFEVDVAGQASAAAPDDIPELTDTLGPLGVDAPARDAPGVASARPSSDAGALPLRQALAPELPAPPEPYPPAALGAAPPEPYPPAALGAAPPALDGVPLLTDVVEEIEAPSIVDPAAESDWGEPSVWLELAESIRVQVLQHVDLFADTGLQEQLARRLQPIVDRMCADLVAAIGQQVGQLIRAHVLEAINGEIEKWRTENP